MRAKIELASGQKFGRLTLIRKTQEHSRRKGEKTTHEKWLCECECGTIRDVFKIALLRTKEPTLSCGCYARDRITAANYKHGDTNSRLFRMWSRMRNRCYNPNSDHRKWYFDKGVRICEEWRNDFLAFKAWALVNGYSDILTIDRIDTDGDYAPENCRFVDHKTQANNRTNNKRIEHDGLSLTHAEWSEKLGYKNSRGVVPGRIKRGWSVEEAVTTCFGEKRGVCCG